MRVVNHSRWRRTKWQACLILWIATLWSLGGLEDADYNSKSVLVFALPSALLMTIHLVKGWQDTE